MARPRKVPPVSTNQFDNFGVQFQYPENWELEEQADDQEAMISLQSPGTAFWSLTLYYERPEPDAVIDSAISAYSEEYEEHDIYPLEANLCQRETVGKEVEFVCLELVNKATVQSFLTDRFTAVLITQSTDYEGDEIRKTLEAISMSLTCDENMFDFFE